MKVVQWILDRKKYQSEQTVGTMDVILDNVWQYSLATLEQEWNDNEPFNSCIPAGTYIVTKHKSPNHGDCFLVNGVPNRGGILFHILNFFKQSKGCVGPGLYHAHLNSDEYVDVAESSKAMEKLKDTCKGDVRILLTVK